MAALTVKVIADKFVRAAEKTLMLFASVAVVKHVSSANVLHTALAMYVGVEITLTECVKVDALLNYVSV
jgi:hypothetical protein